MYRHAFARLARLSMVFLSTATLLHAEEVRPFPERKLNGGELKYVSGVPVLIVQGTPEEIGRQYAVLPVEESARLAWVPKEILKRCGVESAWPAVAAVGRTLLSHVPADHRTELDEMAKSLGVDRDVLVVANTMLELRRLAACSVFIAQGDRSTAQGPLFGRNLDFLSLGILDKVGLVTVLRPAGKHAFASIGLPGLIVVMSGMNDAGLAVATLDVGASKDGAPLFDPSGTPLMFSYRRVLEECTTVEEAEKLLRKTRPTTYANLAVCDTKGGAVFELTPKNLIVRRPDHDVLPCTNHFRTPELSVGAKCPRYAVFEQALQRPEFGVKDVARLMHAVNQGERTIQTMIFEPVARRVHIALGPGPASARPLQVLNLAPLLAEKRPSVVDRPSPSTQR
jgi:isopenicillin-N N-acyltransferase-like protein